MTVYQIILLVNASITGFLSAYAWRFRKTPAYLSFSALMFAATIYAAGYAFEVGGETYEKMRFWLYVEYFGISFIPPLWLIFTLQYLGFSKWVKRPVKIALLVISVITLILNLSNDYHHLFYKNIQVDTSGPFPALVLEKGIWYWVHIAYFNLAVFISTILFVNHFYRVTVLYRRQMTVMLAGSFAPWILDIIYITGLGPENIDLNPFAGMITGIFFAWGIFVYRLLDVFPVALENVFESMGEGVIVLDHQLRVLHFNPAARRIFLQLDDFSIGKDLSTVIHHVPAFASPSLRENAESLEFDLSFDDPPGHFHLSLNPILNRKKHTLGKILIINDITEQKITQNVLQQNEQKLRELNAAKDKVLSIIGHDLRNPFHSISGVAGILLDSRHPVSEAEKNEFIADIQSEADNANALLENLLLWARNETGMLGFHPESIQFHELAAQCLEWVERQANRKKIELRMRVKSDAVIKADRNMISTILRNLLSNAIKYTGENGIVSLALLQDEHQWKIIVADNGMGMNENDTARLFSLHSNKSKPGTRGEKGSGIGLVICHDFIKRHKGSMKVRSEPGKGTQIELILPR